MHRALVLMISVGRSACERWYAEREYGESHGKVVNNMSVLFIEGIGVPHGTFVAKIEEGNSSMEFEPIGPTNIDLTCVDAGTHGLRIYTSNRMFAVVVTVRKNGALYQQWVEPAGIAGKTGIAEVRVPMPKRERREDGREYFRISDLVAFLGPDAYQLLLTAYGGLLPTLDIEYPHLGVERCTLNTILECSRVAPARHLIRAADARDACILAFVGDGTQ